MATEVTTVEIAASGVQSEVIKTDVAVFGEHRPLLAHLDRIFGFGQDLLEEVGVPIVAETALQGESAVVFASFHEPGYDAAVAELERLLEAGRDRLDPTTVTVLERSLATIDQAISEARAALETDPTNDYLSEHLSETMNQKVRLLRQAARLATAAS